MNINFFFLNATVHFFIQYRRDMFSEYKNAKNYTLFFILVIKQAMCSFVTFTFSTKFLCGVNQISTVIAVIQIPNLRQAFMSKSRNLMSLNAYCKCIIISRRHRFVNLTLPGLKIIGVRRPSIRPNIMPVPGNIAHLQRSLGLKN
jgi:hypothetical protein